MTCKKSEETMVLICRKDHTALKKLAAQLNMPMKMLLRVMIEQKIKEVEK